VEMEHHAQRGITELETTLLDLAISRFSDVLLFQSQLSCFMYGSVDIPHDTDHILS